jgi:tetratricopeptide (TPR) repeat protein
MRLKGPIIKPRRVTPKELSHYLFEIRRPLMLGVLSALVLIFVWWGYRTWQAMREDAAQAILSDGMQILATAQEPSEAGDSKAESGGRAEQALAILNRVSTEYPSTKSAEQALLQIGNTLFALGKYQEALVAYQQYLEDYPNGSWLPLAGMGRAYAMEVQGQYRVGASIFRSLAERYKAHPLAPEASMGLARCLKQDEQRDEALEVYRRVLKDYAGSAWSAQAEEEVAVLERG